MPVQPGETIHYVISASKAALPDDRVRVVAGGDGTIAYDIDAYVTLIRKAVLVLLVPLKFNVKSLDHGGEGK